MKSLILFDGSRNSELSLLNACQDAYNQAAHLAPDAQPETNEVLVVIFENMVAANQLPDGQNQLLNLLEKAVQRLECCGEFLKIRGEIIQCQETESTRVLIARAKEEKADTIYFPVAFDPAQAEKPRRKWFGFGPKIETSARTQPKNLPVLASDLFDVMELLENGNCRLVLTNRDGVASRMYCVKPAVARRVITIPNPAYTEAKREAVLR